MNSKNIKIVEVLKSNKILRVVGGLIALAMLANCSARDIVQEANPSLDPDPVASVPASAKSADPLASKQWNLDKVGARGQQATKADGSKRIVVAIIGTGVDYTHEDLAANILVNRAEWKSNTNGSETAVDQKDDDNNGYVDDFVGYDFVENDGLPYDRNGAGTAMAGIVGAVSDNGKGISGLVPNVSLLPIRYIDSSGHMLIPNLFKALKYALDMKVDVILLHTPSYEFGASAREPEQREAMILLERQMLKKSLSLLETAGIPIVVSAGNSGASVEGKRSLMMELFSSPNVIAVTAVDKNDARPFVANYSREKVHTAAPGKEVLSTAPGNQYETSNSTSLAAAHVAAALALALDEQYGKQETRRLLEAFIKPEASDPLESMKFETIGGNRLNLAKYLNYINR